MWVNFYCVCLRAAAVGLSDRQWKHIYNQFLWSCWPISSQPTARIQKTSSQPIITTGYFTNPATNIKCFTRLHRHFLKLEPALLWYIICSKLSSLGSLCCAWLLMDTLSTCTQQKLQPIFCTQTLARVMASTGLSECSSRGGEPSDLSLRLPLIQASQLANPSVSHYFPSPWQLVKNHCLFLMTVLQYCGRMQHQTPYAVFFFCVCASTVMHSLALKNRMTGDCVGAVQSVGREQCSLKGDGSHA